MMLWLWAGLLGVLTVLVAAEFIIQSRRQQAVSTTEAISNTLTWVLCATIFAILVYHLYRSNWELLRPIIGQPEGVAVMDPATFSPLPEVVEEQHRQFGSSMLLQFITSYITEVALSLDNIAILALLFAFYKIPQHLMARALFWCVVVSLIIRLALILLAGSLIHVPWFHFVFVGMLLVAMFRTLLLPDTRTNFNRLMLSRVIRRLLPVARGGSASRSDKPEGEPQSQRLLTRRAGRLAITPLFLVILIAGGADLTYTADFLPAVFSITRDPFIAFAANAFALLTLRSLFFTIAPVMGRFRYLKLSLVFIMLYIAVNHLFFHGGSLGKELTRGILRGEAVTLGVVAGSMLIGVGASVLVNKRRGVPESADIIRPAPIEDLAEAALIARRNARKVMILLAGSAVIIFGLIIAPLPGPGPVILVPIGLGILATEFIWAQRLLRQMKEHGDVLAKTSDRLSARIPKWAGWAAIPLWIGIWYALYRLAGEHHTWRTIALSSAFGTSFPFFIWVYRLLRRKPAQ